jgi:hypothetical protein
MDRPNSKKVQYRLGAFNSPRTISRYVVGHGWHEANSEVRASRFEARKLGRGGRRLVIQTSPLLILTAAATHWVTSLAMAKSVFGIVRPRAFAVFIW